jgi:hypothetical protein
MGGAWNLQWELKNAHKILVGKREGKRPPQELWTDNIKMHSEEKVCDDVDWIHLAQNKFNDRLFWTYQRTFRFRTRKQYFLNS